MTLPKMDMPVGIVEWEVFVPDNYSVRAIDGNVIDRRSPMDARSSSGIGAGSRRGAARSAPGSAAARRRRLRGARCRTALPGQIRGRARTRGRRPAWRHGRARGRAIAPGRRRHGADGSFLLSGVPSGPVTDHGAARGFQIAEPLVHLRSAAAAGGFHVAGRGSLETVTVRGRVAGCANGQSAARRRRRSRPSQNVINLQRRAAGVLPVRVDVPRAGTSHQFVKPLVVDQEAAVTFRYKRR